MARIKAGIVFAAGLGLGLVVRPVPSEQKLAVRALRRQQARTAQSRRDFEERPGYATARRLVLHLSAQHSMGARAQEVGAQVPEITLEAEAISAALSARRLARTREEREEAERLLIRAEQVGL